MKLPVETRLPQAEPLPLIRTPDGIPDGWYLLIGDDGVPELGRVKRADGGVEISVSTMEPRGY